MAHKLSTIIVGAGRLGKTLASMFHSSGMDVSTLVCRTEESAKKAVEFIGCGKGVSVNLESEEFSSEFISVLNEAPNERTKLVLQLSLSDDLLAEKASSIAALKDSWKNVYVFHLSGGLGLDVLAQFENRGAKIGSFHVCYPVSAPLTTLPRDGSICYSFCGDSELEIILRDYVKSWNGKFIVLPKTINRALYHAGNVLSAGHLISLSASAEELLKKAGISAIDTKLIISSVTSGVLEDITSLGANEAISKTLIGPFVRQDWVLINRQLKAIREHSPQFEQLYSYLGEITSNFCFDRNCEKQ